jgi:hypothetical protein
MLGPIATWEWYCFSIIDYLPETLADSSPMREGRNTGLNMAGQCGTYLSGTLSTSH